MSRASKSLSKPRASGPSSSMSRRQDTWGSRGACGSPWRTTETISERWRWCTRSSRLRPPRYAPSWVWQRWGLISGVTGFGLLVVEAVVADSASRLLASVLLGLAIGLMAVGLALIALGPRRDRPQRL